MKASVVVGRGAQAVERRLIAAVLSASRPGTGPRDFERPVRVIVPSRSLREHLCASLVRESGRALVAVTVQTLYAAAREILAREQPAPESADHLLPVLVRRHARGEPLLSRALDDLQDGYAIAVATVRDLLDAGLDPARARSGAHALADDAAQAERARALLRVAEQTRESLHEYGLSWTGEILSTAAARLRKSGAEALPARAVFVHGFAEATGRASDLIEAITRVHEATVHLDHPPHPLAPERDDPGVAFTERLRQRLASAASLEQPDDPAAPAAELRLLRAPGATAELREVAQRIAALIDDGAQPESIGVVTRALDAYALPLRQQFARLGLPFSGVDGKGPPSAAGRRLHALADLLRRGADTPVDRWLDALGWLPGLGSRRAPEPRRNPVRQDLSLALHALGAGRLRDVAELDLAARLPGGGSIVLPVRRGLVAPDEEDSHESVRAERRRLPRAVMETAIARARSLCERLEGWYDLSSAERHLRELRGLLDDELAWTDAVPASVPGSAIVDALARGTPPALELSFDDFTGLVQRQVGDHDRAPIGGRGAGVQVLDVTEARGRTFAHLFLIGMNREVFPRTISEDPLLPDELRARLARALPELAIKASGHQEESYLYAQLLSSTPHATLSWQYIDDEGQARSPSSLVERQLLSQPGLEPDNAPPPWKPDPGGQRPAHEHAVLYALAGEESAADAMMQLAFEAGSPGLEAAELVAARRSVRREYDAGGPRGPALGPYLGFLGPVRERADARRADLYVTTLERYAICPWQTLLLRMLRLETTPDALDALPSLDPRLVGSAVHAALEEIAAPVRDASGERSLSDLTDAAPVFVRWPDEATLDAILRDAARGVLQGEGVDLPGLAGALAERARGYVEIAREHVFEGGHASLLGAEIAGSVVVGSEGAPALHFRVDLVERIDAHLRLTDYKTGRPLSNAVRESTRRTHLHDKIASGKALQAAAYRIGAGADAEGRYLFLEPGLTPERSEFAIRAGDDDLAAAFHATLETLLGGIEQGVFFPRLLDATLAKSPPTCRWCDVAEACVFGDSGARRRLARFAEQGSRLDGEAEAVLLDLWELGQ